VRPTRVGTLVAVALAAAGLAYLAVAALYGSLPSPPPSAAVTLVLLALAELALAKVVRDRVQHRLDAAGRPPRRALHPVQVARAAALAKASSLTGAVVLGAYAGLFAWTAPRTDVLAAAADDAPVAAVTALAGLALVVCALLLERACRVPDPPDDPARLGSQA
jgi:hypothetical protein